MTMLISRFYFDKNAATSIEYALIAVGVAVAIVAAVNALGTTVLTTKFQTVSTSLNP